MFSFCFQAWDIQSKTFDFESNVQSAGVDNKLL